MEDFVLEICASTNSDSEHKKNRFISVSMEPCWLPYSHACFVPWIPKPEIQKKKKIFLLHVLTAKQCTGWASACHHYQFQMPYTGFSQALIGVSEIYCRFQRWALPLQIITRFHSLFFFSHFVFLPLSFLLPICSQLHLKLVSADAIHHNQHR